MSMGLSEGDIYTVVQTAMDCGLGKATVRPRLLSGLPDALVARLQTSPIPEVQLQFDLYDLLQAREEGDHEPLLIWLRNAEIEGAAHRQVVEFSALRAWLTAERAMEGGPPKVCTTGLPDSGPHLVGREDDVALLEAAWHDPDTRVFGVVAPGGTGKTALVRHWLDRVGQRGYDGAARVFAWSFHGSAAGEASADVFCDRLCSWLSDEASTEAELGPLAVRVCGQRTLLILDGVEPLQYPSGPLGGRFRDPALAELLGTLVDRLDGLCIVSSQLPLTDLAPWLGGGYRAHALGRLSVEAGAEVLRRHGVHGSAAALEAAAREGRGHALTLRLLGGYLAAYRGGDVHQRAEIWDPTEADDEVQARQVLRAYEAALDPASLAVLQGVGLFDRPAEPAALATLWARPSVHGLNAVFYASPAARVRPGRRLGKYRKIHALSLGRWRSPARRTWASVDRHAHTAWRTAVAHLTTLGLLIETDTLDVHPLVRTHFHARLQATAPAAWQVAQERLYRHFAAVARQSATTIEAQEVLVRAVVHGCAAGRYEEALNEVYWERLARPTGGAPPGLKLAALVCFFVEPWSHPHPSLSASDQESLAGEVGYSLHDLDRGEEAVAPLERQLRAVRAQLYRSPRYWLVVVRGHIELLLSLGRLPAAEALAREMLADGEGISWAVRTLLADTLHQRGCLAAARDLLVEVEHAELAYPLRAGLPSYLYGDLLLTEGRVDEARAWAEQMLVHAIRHGGGLGDAHLLLGRAQLAATPNGPVLALAAHHLDAAISGAREAGDRAFLAFGLRHAAALHRAAGRFARARRDITEALALAERAGLRLALCDAHLESARLHLAEGHLAAAQRAYELARAEVEALGYHRRDAEVADLAAALDLGCAAT